MLWRNSLVFHSLDKITSLFIHLLPGLITFLWRWYPLENHEISPMCTDSTCKMSFSKLDRGGGEGGREGGKEIRR